MPEIAIIVQARTASTRLPNKVLLKAGGISLIQHELNRLKKCACTDLIILATSENPSDDLLASSVSDMGFPVFRGSETDVLSRYHMAAQSYGLTDVVRITGDCPFIDPEIVDMIVGGYIDQKETLDYASNTHPATWPDGTDVEVFSMQALKTAAREAKQIFEREHVTPFIWRQPKRFRLKNFTNAEDWSQFRLTVDDTMDFTLTKQLVELFLEQKMMDKNLNFFPKTKEIIRLIENTPKLFAINKGHLRDESLWKQIGEVNKLC